MFDESCIISKNMNYRYTCITFYCIFFSDYKYDPIKLHHLSKANAANLLKRKTGQTLTSTESEVNKQLTGSAIVDNLFAGSSKQNSFSSPIKLQDPAPSALSIIEEYLEEELLGISFFL